METVDKRRFLFFWQFICCTDISKDGKDSIPQIIKWGYNEVKNKDLYGNCGQGKTLLCLYAIPAIVD